MADGPPLGSLFLDLDAYFASVEQAERPELRGRPVAVVPLMADTTFVIAASYEAKASGVKTGTRVAEAKGLCPGLELVEARPSLYVHYHARVLEALESVLPVDKVCSIDEMRFRLIGEERRPERAVAIAREMKRAVRERVAPTMTCSAGIAPNAFLAKLATGLQKPDGLVVLESRDLPDRIRGLRLTEFPGINRRMEARLRAQGIFDSDGLLEASQERLRAAFGGMVGERWHRLLRGEPVESEAREGRSLGHSHVLPPDLRTDHGARDVLLRLAHKAAARLRKNGFVATRMTVSVVGRKSWSAECRLPSTNDTVTVTDRALGLWRSRDFEGPLKVGVVFTGLSRPEDATPSLFEDTAAYRRLSESLDELNQRFGKNTVYLASLERVRDKAGEKIAFDKTWLFSEGKDDNVWKGPSRGLGERP
jgi:DNA polymerase-4